MSKPWRSAVASLAVIAALTPTVAHAERWAGGDPRADVGGWNFDAEPAPCGTFTEFEAAANTNEDITGLVVRHTRTDVRLVVRFRDLAPTLDQFVVLHVATGAGRGWFLDVDRFKTPSGKYRTMGFLAKEPRYPDPEDIEDECGTVGFTSVGLPCRTHPEVDLDANEVRATVSRSCLKNPRWVRVGVDSHGSIDDGDPGDRSYGGYSDEWGIRDETASPWLPPFGPKVRAAPGATLVVPAKQAANPSREIRTRRFVVPRVSGATGR